MATFAEEQAKSLCESAAYHKKLARMAREDGDELDAIAEDAKAAECRRKARGYEIIIERAAND